MKVTIDFKIDKATLEQAIINMLEYKTPVSKKAIIKRIKEEVHSKGFYVIEYPEYWGDRIFHVDEVEVERLLLKYSSLIEQ